MPIRVITGQPGNGKTLLMMEELLAQSERADRPLFAAGVDGLAPGIASVLDDPTQWNAKDGQGNYLVPDGAIVYVDEAWKWFGHLHDARGQQTPKHVLDLAEHRHRGLDFVWTTQMPNQLYPFVRGLIGGHTHVVRRFGTQMIDTYEWGELCEEVKSQPRRDNAIKKTRLLPIKKAGAAYKSASQHTIKARIPLKVLMLPVLLVVAAVLFYFGYGMVKPEAIAATYTTAGPEAPSGAPAPVGGAESQARATGISHASASAYAAAMTPQLQEMPWTAKAFEGRSVVAEPEVYCMASEAGETAQGWREASVTCLTEQGTLYRMDTIRARKLARNGPSYNPYRKPEKEREAMTTGAGQRPAVDGRSAPAVAVVGIGEAGEPPAASAGVFRP